MSGSVSSILEQINGGILGLCKPRTESTPFTIYPFLEPVIFLNDASGTVKTPTDEQGELHCSEKTGSRRPSFVAKYNIHTFDYPH